MDRLPSVAPLLSLPHKKKRSRVRQRRHGGRRQLHNRISSVRFSMLLRDKTSTLSLRLSFVLVMSTSRFLSSFGSTSTITQPKSATCTTFTLQCRHPFFKQTALYPWADRSCPRLQTSVSSSSDPWKGASHRACDARSP